MHQFRAIVAGVAALTAGALIFVLSHHSVAAAVAGPCGEMNYSSMGVTYEIRFAKNGSVQQYLLARSSHNTEKDHDVLKELQARYGPEGVNAPPLQITSFRPGANGMMIPDKAVDSCGRVVHFH
jgi:hypothetical protein